jgi:hypothetical protein
MIVGLTVVKQGWPPEPDARAGRAPPGTGDPGTLWRIASMSSCPMPRGHDAPALSYPGAKSASACSTSPLHGHRHIEPDRHVQRWRPGHGNWSDHLHPPMAGVHVAATDLIRPVRFRVVTCSATSPASASTGWSRPGPEMEAGDKGWTESWYGAGCRTKPVSHLTRPAAA